MAQKMQKANEVSAAQASLDAILAETKILDLDGKSPALIESEDKEPRDEESNQDCEDLLEDIEEDLSRSVSGLEAVSSEWEDQKPAGSKDVQPADSVGHLSSDLTVMGSEETAAECDDNLEAQKEEDNEDEEQNGSAANSDGEDLEDENLGMSVSVLREELTSTGISDVASDADAAHPRRVITPRRVVSRSPSDISRSPSPDIAGMSITHEEGPSRPWSAAASPPRTLNSAPHPAPELPEPEFDGEEGEERPKAVMPWPKRADAHYECLESCGAGSYGEVYKARERGGERKLVAVKVIECDGSAVAEAGLLRTLDHPCICKLYDTFQCPEEGVTCLVMQYASGGDLLSRIVSSGPLTEQVAADLARHLLKALQHMHAQGVLHRDLKPENVLYVSASSMEQPLLADFGLGKRLPLPHARSSPSDLPSSSDAGEEGGGGASECVRGGSGLRTHSRRVGTVGYSAPEINSAQGHSFAADVWSFGALLYVLLCGYHPFDMGDDPDHVIQERVAKGEVLPMEGDSWQSVSPEAKDFVRQCLVVDVKERASIQQCLAHPWLSMGRVDVVELVSAFERLKVYRSSRRHSKSVAAHQTATRLKRKREASVASDDSSAGSLTPTPSKRFLNVPYLPSTHHILEWAVCESEPTLAPRDPPPPPPGGSGARKRAISAEPGSPAPEAAAAAAGPAGTCGVGGEHVATANDPERAGVPVQWGKRERREGAGGGGGRVGGMERVEERAPSQRLLPHSAPLSSSPHPPARPREPEHEQAGGAKLKGGGGVPGEGAGAPSSAPAPAPGEGGGGGSKDRKSVV